VIEAGSDARCMAVLRATVAIGQELGVLTHAEGVETREQLELLRSIGCDAVQGYLVGRPVVPFTDAVENLVPMAVGMGSSPTGDESASVARMAA